MIGLLMEETLIDGAEESLYNFGILKLLHDVDYPGSEWLRHR